MPQTLSEWDRDTAPKLGAIEQYAAYIGYYADQITRCCEVLETRPDFETKAEWAMQSAIEKISQAILAYHGKPTEK